MKKKLPFIIGGIILLVAIVVLVVIAFGGKNDSPSKELSIEGTWKVAVYVNGENVNVIDNEFMVFDKETAKDYRNNTSDPYVSSKYTLKSTELSLTDISKKYTIESRTDNYIRLYENEKTYMELFRYQNADMSSISVDSSLINGKWNIIYRNTDSVYAGDYLSFEEGKIGQYKSGSSDPVATSKYEIKDNHLIVESWGKDMVLYPYNGETIIMVEITTDNGFIWELEKSK